MSYPPDILDMLDAYNPDTMVRLGDIVSAAQTVLDGRGEIGWAKVGLTPEQFAAAVCLIVTEHETDPEADDVWTWLEGEACEAGWYTSDDTSTHYTVKREGAGWVALREDSEEIENPETGAYTFATDDAAKAACEEMMLWHR